MADEERYVVRYQKWNDGTSRMRTFRDPEGLFESIAEAREVMNKLGKTRIVLKSGLVTKLPKYKNIRIVRVKLPARILTWDKWSELRMEIRRDLLAAGLAHSGGDRTPERNAEVNGVPNSSHLTSRTDRWADDYVAGGNLALLHRAADLIRRKYGNRGRLEILVHDAGSGQHFHIGGPTDGNN